MSVVRLGTPHRIDPGLDWTRWPGTRFRRTDAQIGIHRLVPTSIHTTAAGTITSHYMTTPFCLRLPSASSGSIRSHNPATACG